MDLKQIAIEDGLQATLVRAKAQLTAAGHKLKVLRAVAGDDRGDPGKRLFAQMTLEFSTLRVDDLVHDLDASLRVLEIPGAGAGVAGGCALARRVCTRIASAGLQILES